MNIIHLIPEVPTKVGGGGNVRNWHFAIALSSNFNVTTVVLTEKKDSKDDFGLLGKYNKLLQPNNGFNAVNRNRRYRMLSLHRSIDVLFSFMKEHGKYIVIAGNGNCVHRARKRSLSTLYKLYAFLLLLETKFLWRIFKFYPSNTLVRYEEFLFLMPKIVEIHKLKPFDLIWCEHSYLYPLVEQLVLTMQNIQVVCDAHNNERLLLRSFAEKERISSAKRWLYTESNITAYWEKRMLERADLIFCCSDLERDHFVTLLPISKNKIKVISNGVDTEYFKSSGNEFTSKKGILFAGSAGYWPNDDAVRWLVKKIMPIVRRSLPSCYLYLAGRCATEHWGHYEKESPWVSVVSDVPDMRPWFEKSLVFVVPLRFGSGTRLKILEAMSMSKAVVSTTLGAEGLDVVSGIHLLLNDNTDSIANSVISLINNREDRRTIEKNARQLVVEQYQWNVLTRMAVEKCQNTFY